MCHVLLDTEITETPLVHDDSLFKFYLTAHFLAEPYKLTEPTEALHVRTREPLGYTVPPGWYGFIDMSGPGIVYRAWMDRESGLDALERLAAKAPDDIQAPHEGRHMARIVGGYLILTFDERYMGDEGVIVDGKDFEWWGNDPRFTRQLAPDPDLLPGIDSGSMACSPA